MATTDKMIKVTRGGEVARVLDEAGEETVLLEKDGNFYRLYRLTPAEVVAYRAEDDTGAMLEALDATVGSWADLDAEALIAGLRRARAEGSRPADRP